MFIQAKTTMGKSKKKIRKSLKIDDEELRVTAEEMNRKSREAQMKNDLTGDDLFTTNTKKEGLKKVREKLKADRFKEEENRRTSKTETVLIKRLARKMENRKPAGGKLTAEEEEFGELEDLWSQPRKITSVKHERYRNGFAKSDTVNVKSVILPVGGQSYNPSLRDHKSLLKDLASKEEEQVKKNLREMQKLNPLKYAEEPDKVIQAASEVSEGEEQDSSDEEIDPDMNPAVNAPVDRLNLKTQA